MTVTYNGAHAAAAATDAPRAVWPAMRRGMLGRCPHCGEGALFSGFLKVAESCPTCGEDLHHQRADDFPPYATIFIVGHLIVPAMYLVERTWRPELWIHFVTWLPLTVILSVLLIQPIKGTIVGLQWALRMHGFGGGEADEAVPEPRPAAVRIESRP